MDPYVPPPCTDPEGGVKAIDAQLCFPSGPCRTLEPSVRETSNRSLSVLD